MIQLRTNLSMVDNSGVRRMRCMQVQGGRRPRAWAGVGDRMRASVTRVRPQANRKVGDLVQAMVVRTVKEGRDLTGVRRSAGDNAAVLVTGEGAPLGTRRSGPRYRHRRRRGHGKLASLARRRA